ncbi:MAG: tRNA dihydrouridine synthase DusB [Chromatiales bacterium]|nr:tRNA dihydrouridine synthase DusB [Chromatiales bacterium]
MRIGPYTLDRPVIAAPMAGITDLPYRQLCRRFGAALAVSEMVSADPSLRNTRKSRLRLMQTGEIGLRSTQILGIDPKVMADAARYNVDLGAQIIDINMGCPAKKVCKVAAGSALLQDEALVGRILTAVVEAVDVPVTLKTRTGWDREHINGVRIAQIAEQSGIAAIAIHGRTRACGYSGLAEYDTIARIKQTVAIPVIANGDIDSPEKAEAVLTHTGADALMIGRAAQGRPWLFREIGAHLAGLPPPAPPTREELLEIVNEHLQSLYGLYGEELGVRIARKHLGWYLDRLTTRPDVTRWVLRAETARVQLMRVEKAVSATEIEEELAA